MKSRIFTFALVLLSTFAFAQSGHLMQGIGAVNMSMGGAATGKAMDISGALQWNPASISGYSGTKIGLDVGAMFSSPTLSSSMPMMGPDGQPIMGPDGQPIMLSGSVDSDKGVSPLPSLAIVWGNEDSKHTFGVSVFGVSGFGVDFAEDSNNPGYMDGSMNPNYDPNKPFSPISGPQSAGGFGHIESNYMLLQVGFTWAYQITENFSIGIEPTINYQALDISPNPLVAPSMTAGYSKSETASAIGYGGQLGVYYDSKSGFTAGASYKSKQYMADFSFEGKYLDGNDAPKTDFTMNFPAIASIGVGYTTANGMFDFAVDYRRVFYSSTEGFDNSGWTIASEGDYAGYPTGTVEGFGWEDMNIISAGVQINAIEKLPIRLGYTYNSNPINEELMMFSVSAPAIIKNAFQVGLGYEINEHFTLNGLFHYGTSGGKTTGQMLNPKMISAEEVDTPMGPMGGPLGKIPGSEVSVEMTTMLITVGIQYSL
ncbi:MAG: outer membrane protein transport protein [Flavobacteriales bacterium]|nr:outer membrane protein transport protein [Flavobacteriales bacterium]